MYKVYILKSLVKEWVYVGMSSGLAARVREHNNGNIISTKVRRPYKLVYSEGCASAEEARVREKYFKSGAGKEWLKRRGII